MSVTTALEKKKKDMSTKTNKGGQKKKFPFSGMWAELKKVHWPTKKELAKFTLVVIVAVIIMAVALSIIDFVLGSGFAGLYKLTGN